jgi:nucleoside-diphosphate-sugar epimerase
MGRRPGSVEDMVATMKANPLAHDLDHVLARTGGLWDDLRGARVFMTGGTGFFGCWLLETFLWARACLGVDASVVVLTRDPKGFSRKVPHLTNHPAIMLHEGDVRSFTFASGDYSHVIHLATDALAARDNDARLRKFDTIAEGTRRALEFARHCGARRFLMTSSGAIYGRQPADLTHVPEEYAGAPDPSDATQAGAEAKRAAEALCAVYADERLQPTIARCFAFVGPYLPLDVHFAIGNFIGDALHGGPIRIAGDGTPYRSYLYASDLVIWLLTILLRGQTMRPYNVGSDASVSIAELAHAVAKRFEPEPAVHTARIPSPGAAPERYVPSTARISRELGVDVTVDLDEAITRTVEWYKGRMVSGHPVRHEPA